MFLAVSFCWVVGWFVSRITQNLLNGSRTWMEDQVNRMETFLFGFISYWSRAFFDIFINFPENNAWILDLMWIQIEICVWICFIWYWFEAWMNERGLLDLGGCMCSTGCHSSLKISWLSSIAIENAWLWCLQGEDVRRVLPVWTQTLQHSAESGRITWRWRPWEDHGGTIDSDQIRAPLRMTSGPPQGATQSQQPLTLTDECSAAPHPNTKVKPLKSQGKNPPLDRFTAHVRFCFLHVAKPCPHLPTPSSTSHTVFFFFNVRWALLQQAPRYGSPTQRNGSRFAFTAAGKYDDHIISHLCCWHERSDWHWHTTNNSYVSAWNPQFLKDRTVT